MGLEAAYQVFYRTAKTRVLLVSLACDAVIHAPRQCGVLLTCCCAKGSEHEEFLNARRLLMQEVLRILVYPYLAYSVKMLVGVSFGRRQSNFAELPD